jgi:hypothetical protein
MALLSCEMCGHRVSSTAPRCPRCGADGPAAEPRRPTRRSSRAIRLPHLSVKSCQSCGAKPSARARYCTKCGRGLSVAGSPVKVMVRLFGFSLTGAIAVWLYMDFSGSVNASARICRPTILPAVLLSKGPHAGGALFGGGLIYDPVLNALGIVANPIPAYATMTPLPNGSFLVAGGISDERTGSERTVPEAGSKLYNPGKGTFTTAGNMLDARFMHTAILLPGGRVLLAGGLAGAEVEHGGRMTFRALASTELYDPANNVFTSGPRLMVSRFDAISVLLPSGKVMIAGGADEEGNALSSTEIYDPGKNAFEQGPGMHRGRVNEGVAFLPDKRIAFFGGCNRVTTTNCDGNVASTEFYSPVDNTFMEGPSMNGDGGNSIATTLSTGKVLIVVASVFDSKKFVYGPLETQIYDPASQSFASGPNTRDSFFAVNLIPLSNGKVLINGPSYTALYDAATQAVAKGPSFPIGFPVLLKNGQVLFIGDTEMRPGSATALYDPVDKEFMLSPDLNTARRGPTVTLLPNGMVLVAGGSYPSVDENQRLMVQHALASTELYDQATRRFVKGPDMKTARMHASATLLGNGKVLIVGGESADINGTILDSTELYDSSTNSFTQGPTMNMARSRATSTLLNDDQVLITGGDVPGANVTGTSELYSSSTNSLKPGPDMNVGHVAGKATRLKDGRVLFLGGYTNRREDGKDQTAPPELYDPATNAFLRGPNARADQPDLEAVLLGNGKVLIVSSGCEDSSIDLYDPKTNGFSIGPSTQVPHCGVVAARLIDGKVLIVGGGPMMDVYDPTTNSFVSSE